MFYLFFTYLLKNIHEGAFVIKTASLFTLSVLITPAVLLLERLMEWYAMNIDYIALVIGAIAVDHLIGSVVHLTIKNDFSFKLNITGLAKKLFLVVMIGFLFEGISHISNGSFLEDYLEIVTRLMVFLYPAGSAFVNCSLLTGGKFPPKGWLDKLQDFFSDLKLKK